MNKQEFLAELRKGLSGLPHEDIEERMSFYGEMIDDRVEEGLTEEEAVAEVGAVDDIVAQILADTPLTRLVKEKVKPNRALKAWEIVLIVLGSPIWLSLLLAAIAVFLSVYVALWAVVVSLYAADFALAVAALAGIVGAIVYYSTAGMVKAALLLGAGLVCAGISIFLFFALNKVTAGVVILSKKLLLCIKGLFMRKGDA